jgi:hypothetical protein
MAGRSPRRRDVPIAFYQIGEEMALAELHRDSDHPKTDMRRYEMINGARHITLLSTTFEGAIHGDRLRP